MPAGFVVEQEEFSEQRDVAQSRLRPAIDRETFGPFEGAVDQGDIDLQCESGIETVASDELRDRAVEILAGGIGHFFALELEGPEVSELFRDRDVDTAEPSTVSDISRRGLPEARQLRLRHCLDLRRVASAQVTGTRGG